MASSPVSFSTPSKSGPLYSLAGCSKSPPARLVHVVCSVCLSGLFGCMRLTRRTRQGLSHTCGPSKFQRVKLVFPQPLVGHNAQPVRAGPPPLAGSDGFRNWANLLEISSERAGLGNGTHQGLMRIATDVTPLLSQIATEANQPGDRTAERVGERARRTKVRGSRFEVSGTSNLELPTFQVSHFTLAA